MDCSTMTAAATTTTLPPRTRSTRLPLAREQSVGTTGAQPPRVSSGRAAVGQAASHAGSPYTMPDGCPADAAYVIRRLEEAGSALLALPNSGWTTRMKSSSLQIVRSAAEAYGWAAGRIRPPLPQADAISRMDEAMGWLRLVPEDRHVLRRIVGARSLVHPLTERHLFPWRRLGTALGADHKAVQRWHAEGIDLIVAALLRGAG